MKRIILIVAVLCGVLAGSAWQGLTLAQQVPDLPPVPVDGESGSGADECAWAVDERSGRVVIPFSRAAHAIYAGKWWQSG